MIDMKKAYIYRNGEPARILCTDAPGLYPVISMDRYGSVTRHTANGVPGALPTGGALDLIEVKEKKMLEMWILVYEEGVGTVFSEQLKDRLLVASPNPTACKHVVVEYEEGEGL